MVSILFGTTHPESLCSWYFISCSVIVIWHSTWFNSSSFGFHNVFTYDVKYHLYADDIQLCISLYPNNKLNLSSSLKNLSHCISDIQLWMNQNLLKLNVNNTNIIFLASPYYVTIFNLFSIQCIQKIVNKLLDILLTSTYYVHSAVKKM